MRLRSWLENLRQGCVRFHSSTRTPMARRRRKDSVLRTAEICEQRLLLTPTLLSIVRATPDQSTSAPTVSFIANFSEPVTGVASTDFALVTTGTVNALSIQVSGTGSVYTATVSGITGGGTLGLKVLKTGSIRDLAGNPFSLGTGPFTNQFTLATGSKPRAVQIGDLNGDGVLDLAVLNQQSASSGVFFGNGNGSVSVYLGNGNGTYRDQQTYATG